jgi:hypothetical protein
MILPYHECPSFERCNANVCPLDPFQHEKETLEGEDVCRAEEPTRLRIGEKYPQILKERGLTHKRFQAQERWNALSNEQRQFRLQGLEKARKLLKRGHNEGK